MTLLNHRGQKTRQTKHHPQRRGVTQWRNPAPLVRPTKGQPIVNPLCEPHREKNFNKLPIVLNFPFLSIKNKPFYYQPCRSPPTLLVCTDINHVIQAF